MPEKFDLFLFDALIFHNWILFYAVEVKFQTK